MAAVFPFLEKLDIYKSSVTWPQLCKTQQHETIKSWYLVFNLFTLKTLKEMLKQQKALRQKFRLLESSCRDGGLALICSAWGHDHSPSPSPWCPRQGRHGGLSSYVGRKDSCGLVLDHPLQGQPVRGWDSVLGGKACRSSTSCRGGAGRGTIWTLCSGRTSLAGAVRSRQEGIPQAHSEGRQFRGSGGWDENCCWQECVIGAITLA